MSLTARRGSTGRLNPSSRLGVRDSAYPPIVATERLPEGNGGGEVWRSEQGVHRTAGLWTPTVHAFLHHLAKEGFDGAPTVLGIDDEGREIVTFVDGEVLGAGAAWRPGVPTPWPQWAQTEDCLIATGRLLRAFHEAAATFIPPDGAVWRRHPFPGLSRGEIVCHGDIGPHNTVYRNGLPVAFIDWDTIRPQDSLVEFGDALWHYVPVGSDGYFAVSDFPAPPPLSRRVALFARAYGIDDAEQVRFALHAAKERSVDALRYFPLTPGAAAAALRQCAADLEWLDGQLDTLVSELE